MSTGPKNAERETVTEIEADRKPSKSNESAMLGPIACAVLLTRDLESTASAYEKFLAMTVSQQFSLDEDTAGGLSLPTLIGHGAAMLKGSAGRDWLMLIEDTEAVERDALKTHGWLAQEILVEDVDGLAAELKNSPFKILRPPADLDVSDRIRACQVRGPAGEILYLTQVAGEVPPFELPVCEGSVDHLFIPVLSTPDRDASLAEYAGIARREGLSFDTRITVVNQAHGLPLETRHPVATLQLAGNSLIEIDQIQGTVPPASPRSAGTVSIVFNAAGEAPQEVPTMLDGPFAGRQMVGRTGVAGEYYSLLFEY